MTPGWIVYEGANPDMPPHSVPYEDIYPHEINRSGRCWCAPRDDEGVFVHNSYDRRELVEQGERRVQ